MPKFQFVVQVGFVVEADNWEEAHGKAHEAAALLERGQFPEGLKPSHAEADGDDVEEQ